MNLRTCTSLIFVYFSSIVLAGVPEINADLVATKTGINKLHTATTDFKNPGGTLTDALYIHKNATALIPVIQKCSADVKAGPHPLNESDGKSILIMVEDFMPNIIDTLDQMKNKKQAFDALPVGGVTGLVKQDLIDMNSNTTALGTALIDACPADLKDKATQDMKQISAAFASAMAVYK